MIPDDNTVLLCVCNWKEEHLGENITVTESLRKEWKPLGKGQIGKSKVINYALNSSKIST